MRIRSSRTWATNLVVLAVIATVCSDDTRSETRSAAVSVSSADANGEPIEVATAPVLQFASDESRLQTGPVPYLASDGGAHLDDELYRPEFASDLSPLRLQVGFGPVPYLASDGRVHLDYELYLTNRRPDAVVVKRVRVVDADDPSNVIVDLTGEDLDDFVTSDLDRFVEGPIVAGGGGAIVYIDTSVADFADVPAVLMHIVETEDGESGEPYPTIEGAFRAPLDIDVPVLAQPVSDGVWVAAEGCCFKSHHRRGPFTLNGQDFLAQRYAIDFIKLVDGKLWEGDDPKNLDAWFTYGEDALAVVDGTVSSILTDEDDITPFEPNPKPRNVDNITGNHVIIDMGGGLYVVYAHLQPGSIVVEVGDEVRVGDKLARLGNSGNTDAPHLHIHVMDDNHVVQSHAVPFVFDRYKLLGSFESLDSLLPEPFGEVGPEEPDLLATPERITDAYPLELDIVSFSAGGRWSRLRHDRARHGWRR